MPAQNSTSLESLESLENSWYLLVVGNPRATRGVGPGCRDWSAVGRGDVLIGAADGSSKVASGLPDA